MPDHAGRDIKRDERERENEREGDDEFHELGKERLPAPLARRIHFLVKRRLSALHTLVSS